jgi:hypothetical protein
LIDADDAYAVLAIRISRKALGSQFQRSYSHLPIT